MITIAFYGSRRFGAQRQSKSERKVCAAWRAYFDLLSQATGDSTGEQLGRLTELRNDKFIDLLEAIATAQSFDFEPVELRRTLYSPVHHGITDSENEAIRAGLAKVLSGQTAIPMYVTNLPGQS